MKRFKFIAFLLIFIFSSVNFVSAAEISPPSIDSEGAVLIDATTGKVLYEKNMNKPLAPASTTKVMTALLTLERCKLDDKVLIGKNPPNAEGTAIGIVEGETLTVKDLLEGLLLESANDCAEALAEHIGGSISNFSKIMNDRARQLGCKNTHFVNPSGLYEKDHLTTAYDLALILTEVEKNPTFVDICQQPFYKIPPTDKTTEYRWVNNKDCLVLKGNKYFYKDCIAGKTGYTTPSKHTFTAIAERNGQKLVLALLRSESKDTYFPEAKKLFDYGFEKYTLVKLYSKGDIVKTYNIDNKESIPLIASKDFYYVKEKNSKNTPDPICNIVNKNLNGSSFSRGQQILTSKIMIGNEIVGELALESGIDRKIASNNLAQNHSSSKYIWKTIVYIIIAFMFILACIYYPKKLRKQKIYKKYKNYKNIHY